MDKPKFYEVKKWLCENTICGLKLNTTLTGVDSMVTSWMLYPCEGKPKQFRDYIVEPLVEVRPDYCSVLRVKASVREEVRAYNEFVDSEGIEFAEYQRLKKKFEGRQH